MIQQVNSSKTIKFLYSYGGKIVPRPTDGKLRYIGGFTRVLSVDRCITCSELLMKFGESCGSSMDLKCKLPTEDLDVLVSIKSDEELRIVIEEYERVSPEAKIRAVVFPIKSVKKASPQPSIVSKKVSQPSIVSKKVSQPSSPVSCFDFPSISKSNVAAPFAPLHKQAPPRAPVFRRVSPVFRYPSAAAANHCCYEAKPRHIYPVPHRNCSH